MTAARMPLFGGRQTWYRKARFWLPLALVALLVVFRLALTPLAAWEARRRLAAFQHLRTTFGDLSISLRHGSCTVSDVKTVKLPTPPKGEIERPYFFAKRVEVGIVWKDLLLHHELVAGVRLIEPHINLIQGKTETRKQITPEEPDFSDKLASSFR
jgi:hypothetical protein